MAEEKYPGIYEKYEKEEEPKIDFVCRVCGGIKYEKVYIPITRVMGGKGDGFSYYACADCSVIFRDPEKFSVPNESASA